MFFHEIPKKSAGTGEQEEKIFELPPPTNYPTGIHVWYICLDFPSMTISQPTNCRWKIPKKQSPQVFSVSPTQIPHKSPKIPRLIYHKKHPSKTTKKSGRKLVKNKNRGFSPPREPLRPLRFVSGFPSVSTGFQGSKRGDGVGWLQFPVLKVGWKLWSDGAMVPIFKGTSVGFLGVNIGKKPVEIVKVISIHPWIFGLGIWRISSSVTWIA